MGNNTQHIIAYLENRLTAEERESFEALLDNSAELQQELKDICFVWETSAELKLHKQVDTLKNWDELSGRIAIDKYRKKIWYFARNIAAVLMIPLFLSTVFLFRTIRNRDKIPVQQLELTSANGLVTKVKLSDGTEVWLNSGSKLSYPQYFTGDVRRVMLSGEAYFKVEADKTNRFEVETSNDVKVAAYGTEFNVCAYEEDPFIDATLVTGNIEVAIVPGKNNDVVNISEGQQAVFDKNNNNIQIAEANLAVKTSWKDGKMVFRRTGMVEITRRLSRHFNVDIRLEGKELYHYEYSASFTNETLEDILYLLEKSAPIKCRIIYPEESGEYTYTKKTVIISMRGK